MRISTAALMAGLALSLATATVAQAPAAPAKDPQTAKPASPADPAAPAKPAAPTEEGGGPVPGAPMDAVAPKMPAPSEGWTEADKSAANVEKGTQTLAAAQKAYQEAPQLSDTVKLAMMMPDGTANDTIQLAFGKGTDMEISMGSLKLLAVGDKVYFVPDQPADKYIERTIDGNVSKTLGALLPGFSIPAPDLILREKGSDPITAFGLGAVEGLKVAGFREKDGKKEVLFTGKSGEGVAAFDAKTGFVTASSMLFTPPGVPEGMDIKIGVQITHTPSTEPLKTPIAFDAGKRKAVKSIEELLDQPQGSEQGPEVKVKEGDVAPVAVLTTLDGKSVDIGALKGKVVVMDFWATWCGPCRKGLPLLEEFAKSMKDNDKVVVYPVNVWEQNKGDELTKKVGEFWTKQGYTMTTLLDPDAKLIGQYGFQGIPAMVIIGPDGKISSTHIGYDPGLVKKLTEEVNKALGTTAK